MEKVALKQNTTLAAVKSSGCVLDSYLYEFFKEQIHIYHLEL